MLGEKSLATRQEMEKLGLSWTAFSCSFWYELSLAGTEARYGFDFAKKTVTFYDEGETKITTSTWSQVGRAVAGFFSLPLLPQDENDKSSTISSWNDKAVLVSSFRVSLRDMLDSVLRVTGEDEGKWTVFHEDVHERYQRGIEMMQGGNMIGFGIALYARAFYKESPADFTSKADNKILVLPTETLDDATKVASEMAQNAQ